MFIESEWYVERILLLRNKSLRIEIESYTIKYK
jgi:hypothetical protein